MDLLRTAPARWSAVAWVAVNGAALAACLAAAGPGATALSGPAELPAAQACAALFFLIFLWPVAIPPCLRAARAASVRPAEGPGDACLVAVQLGGLAVLGWPFGFLAARLSAAGAAPFRSLAVLAACAACVAAVYAGGRWRRPGTAVAHQAAAWVLSAGAPLAYYLGREWLGAEWEWLAAASPFRGAADPDGATPWGPVWAVQTGAYAALACAIAGAGAWWDRKTRGGTVNAQVALPD